jgi:hypothetical protein
LTKRNECVNGREGRKRDRCEEAWRGKKAKKGLDRRLVVQYIQYREKLQK